VAGDRRVRHSVRLVSLIVAAWVAVCPAARADDATAAVRALIDGGRYPAAVERAREWVDGLAANEPQAVPARQLLVEALLADGRGAEPATQALARTLLASTPTGTLAARATSERLLGQVLLEAGSYRAAAMHVSLALTAHEAALGPRAAALADDLDVLTEIRIWRYDYGAALTASDRALGIREAGADVMAPALARTLELRTLLWQRRDERKRARTDLERALAIRERAGPTHPALVRALTLMGDQLKLEGAASKADAVLQRAVEIAEASLRPGHPETANALRTWASVRHYVDPDQAAVQDLRERALAIAQTAYGPDHPMVAMQLNDLAISHEARGNFGTSRRLMRQSLAIYERALGPANLGVLVASFNLGNRNIALGDYQEALALFRRVAREWTRNPGPRSRHAGLALGGMGEALSKMRRDREALVYLTRALAIREMQEGASAATVGDTLLLMAESWSRLGDHAHATGAATRALDIRERGDSPGELAEALLVGARIEAASGDSAAAQARAERALAVARPILGDAHPTIGAIQAVRAAALIGVGQPAEARLAALDAERIGREHLQRTMAYLPERQALTYAATRPQGIDLALSALTPDASSAPLLDAIVRGRALTLDEMAERRRSAAGTDNPTTRGLRAALVESSERLAGLVIRGPRDQTPAQYQADVERARRERERAELALAEADADVRSAVARRHVALDDVRSALSTGTALVSFVRYRRSPVGAAASGRGVHPAGGRFEYLAFVLRPDRAAAAVVPLGTAEELDAAVAGWRRDVVSGIGADGTPLPGTEATLRRRGTALRERIWDPVAPHLQGAGRVFVVPDGALNLLPLAALPVDDTRYLVDVGPTIHYLSAERDLVAPIDRPRIGEKGLLALGGPAYGGTGKSPPPTASRRRAAPCGSFESMTFAELPDARREAQDISTLWRTLDGGANLLVGARATEGAFKRDAPGHRILHVATHGFFLGNDCEAAGPEGTRGIGRRRAAPRPLPDNPLLWSGLALAGANQRFSAQPSQEDGILTAEEVAAMDLDGVEWAVLSACDTGVGAIRPGEGVFGLRRAFRIAGARTIVMSLWAVEDRAARAWMRPLYEGRLRDHLSTAEAVRHASQTVLADRRAKRLSTHPFYWAGFVAAGDWR
jgi:CHAT domain-containing protein